MRKTILYTLLTLLVILATTFTYLLLPESKLPKGTKIDYLLVDKSNRIMYVYWNGKLVKRYKISTGKRPGSKEFEGDRKTPVGTYFITDKNTHSSWYKNLGVSYPNQADIERCRKLGKSTGGSIKIHGIEKKRALFGKIMRFRNFTYGCIAVINSDMDELYNAVVIGSKIEIRE